MKSETVSEINVDAGTANGNDAVAVVEAVASSGAFAATASMGAERQARGTDDTGAGTLPH